MDLNTLKVGARLVKQTNKVIDWWESLSEDTRITILKI